jgi:AraC-like DNA-binding protein
MTPYHWLVDLRGLELVEPATFSLFLEHTRKNGPTLGRNIVKQAQLRPEGIVGAVIAGFSRVARLSYPDRVFGEVDEALGWLGIDKGEGVALLAALEAIRRESREGHAVVARLQQELDWQGGLAIEDAASRLGTSTRSLQRALREAGTTYRAEIDAFRIRRAQDLLRRDERTLSWIAQEVGFSSAQHFATAFRRAIGETPSGWRERNKRIPAGGEPVELKVEA